MGISIGQLAAQAGVNTSAIRYYERAGVLPPPGRSSGRRVYDADAIRLLSFVVRARSSGFSIEEVRDLSSLMRRTGTSDECCDDARDFARTKIAELDRQISEAKALKRQLTDALEADCTGEEHCAVLSR